MIDTRAHFTAIIVSLTLALFGTGWLLFHLPVDEQAPGPDAAQTATSGTPADAVSSSS
jgi:hypothetical protein